MADREKVIKGIECHRKKIQTTNSVSCLDCPYAEPNPIREWCMSGLMDDMYAMLKEQEAVEPTFKQDSDGIFMWCCGSCGAYMYHIYDGIDKAKEYAKFCRQCGKPVKWK